MDGFGSVVGHADVISHLQNAIRLNKLSHAYIFGGVPGSGKRMVADLFARALECETHGTDSCGQCDACKKARSGNHPDIIHVEHGKSETIKVDEIRDQVLSDVAIKPYSGRYKIYIISEAQNLSEQAQNALLKTIEEPPDYVIILLLTDNPESLLSTIRSRCVLLRFRALPDTVIRQYLMDQLHLTDYQAQINASIALGSIGRARQISTSEEFSHMTDEALRLVKRANDMEMQEIVDAMKDLANEKKGISEYLDMFTIWFRDVLMFKATRETDQLVFKQELKAIKEQASKSSYEGLEEIIDSIEKARIRLRANVNFDLTMELLFLTIRENTK